MRFLFALLLLQAALLVWLHCRALHRNVRRLQTLLAQHQGDAGVWVYDHDGYTFHLCHRCIHHLLTN